MKQVMKVTVQVILKVGILVEADFSHIDKSPEDKGLRA